MSKLEQLMQQKEALEEQIKEAAKEEKAMALAEVRRLCKLHSFTASMLKGSLAAGRKPRAPKK